MTALWIVIKVSALVTLAGVVQAALGRRGSAAARHLVWTLALAAVILLPVSMLVLPAWSIAVPAALSAKPGTVAPVPEAPTTPPARAAVLTFDGAADRMAPASRAAAPAPPPERTVPWSTILLAVYASGVLVILMQLAARHALLRRFARRAADVHDAAWRDLVSESARLMRVGRPVRLLRSREQTIPLAFGIWRPAIVIPSVAETWDDDRRRAVVMHELGHVARHDCLTDRMAAVACAIYWFHPAVWWVARRLRVERELACDDRVIASGTEARDYAGHLLELAYSFSRHRAPALTVAMARHGQLEGRMLAALDAARNRRAPARRVRLVAAAGAIALVCAVAAARPTAVASESPAPAADSSVLLPQADPPVVVARNLHEGGIADAARDITRRLVRRVAAAVGFAQGVPGTWELRRTRDKDTVRLRMVEINSSNDTTGPLDRLEGLTAAQLEGAGGPVQFRIRFDAGTFTFDGLIKNGVGAGTFGFTPDPSFADELARRGFARPTAREQYQLARHDIGFAFVDALAAQGYPKPKTPDLVRAGQHGVRATYVQEMGRLGYKGPSLDDLINLRDHGVTPEYVRDLATQGYKSLTSDDVLEARDHGVTPEYIRGIRDAGYGSLSMDDLVRIRDHGITPEYVRALSDAGYGSLALDDLVDTRDHGVTPEYARALQQLGLSPSIDDLVQLRDHGVTPEYAKGLKSLGYDRLGVDDLITLRDHGLTIERIRSVNARAGTRLPVDLLKSFNGR